MPTLISEQNFSHLSLKDLIEARDMFHLHLMNKKNVVATAIGRYLIRVDEIDENGKYVPKNIPNKPARTLNNSVVIDISWPCILVFVYDWSQEIDLVKEGGSNIVPKTIYMPDGRVVPICIVEAPKNVYTNTTVNIENLKYPTNFIGGGFPVIVDSQKERHYATIGCLVSDGHTYYALTNKHVAGGKGEIIKSKIKGSLQEIGVSAGKEIGKVSFKQLYPEWNSSNIKIACDAGLVAINDIRQWTTLLIGIQEMGELYDLNTYNLSLNLIAEHSVKKIITDNKTASFEFKEPSNGKVSGYGAVSGKLSGEIKALFYRYNSTGGTEYASDFLIGGRQLNDLQIHYGDSGTLWLLEVNKGNNAIIQQPIALHWGQHQLLNEKGKKQFSYSLSTSISNICRELEVELVRDWNIDIEFSWGKDGHYTVGNKAISCIKSPTLKDFMNNNLENISLQDKDINADLDQKGGSPLLVTDTVDNMTVQVWKNYYENIDRASIGLDTTQPVTQGLICFRVWQIFDYLVKAAKNKQTAEFIFAAGILSHYVGDACQPLHSSYMADGDPLDGVSTMYTPPRGGSKHPKGVPYPKIINPGSGVHVAYEDTMIDNFMGEIMPQLNATLNDSNSDINKEVIIDIKNGQEAAFAVLKLMQLTQETIKPKEIVETYKQAKADNADIPQTLYDQFGDRTIKILARGCKYLAAIWDAAWKVGNGDNIPSDQLISISQKELIDLYREPTNLPSLHLNTIENVLEKQ